MKRPYNKKKLEYWNKKSEPAAEAEANKSEFSHVVTAEWDEKSHFSSYAACGGYSTTEYRDGVSPSIRPIDAYKNINAGLLPWEVSNGSMSISNAILLCQKAYANIAIVRNSIESAVEFSNSNLHIKTANDTVKNFFIQWFNLINIYKLKDVFFREYYRSGNVFIYKFDGKFKPEDYAKMQTVFGAKSPVIPLRYVILNPAQIYLQSGIGYNGTYVKALSTYEIERLRSPQTDVDKQIYNSLPDFVKSQLKKGGMYNEIMIPLDEKRLFFAFYKKQDYEPLALPMIYPILNDLEYKLELKKMDMTVAKMIEHAILLITAGEKADAHNSKYNPANIENLKSIFRNQSLGRVLVGDHTIKASWVIPDIGEILSQSKYIQVENDIKEGLQSIIMGEDKFANAQIKARVFIERMKEGQKAFLNNFLIPEIKRLCEIMNFKNVPDIEFEDINLNDPSTMGRVYMRLAELGILSPDETFVAIKSGILPDKESNVVNQKDYKSLRDKGMYEPLIGAGKEDPAGGNGRPAGSKTPKSSNRPTPQGMANEQYSTSVLLDLMPLAESLKEKVEKAAKKKFKIKNSLSDSQKEVCQTLAKTIITLEPKENWEKSVDKYFNELPQVPKEVMQNIISIASEHDLTDWLATIVYKSKI
jgi:hypothetical protein